MPELQVLHWPLDLHITEVPVVVVALACAASSFHDRLGGALGGMDQPLLAAG